MDVGTRVELECSYEAGDGQTRSRVASMPKERSGILGGEYLCFPTALPHLLCSALLDDGNMIIGDKDDFGVVLD